MSATIGSRGERAQVGERHEEEAKGKESEKEDRKERDNGRSGSARGGREQE